MLYATCASIKVYKFFFIVSGYLKKAFQRENRVSDSPNIWFESNYF